MRGLKSQDLVAMVDFLYCGEANIPQENLDAFLAVAEELQLKGLTNSGSGGEKKHEETNPHLPPKLKAKPKTVPKQEDQIPSVSEFDTLSHIKGTVALSEYAVAVEMQDLDDQINSMMETNENINAQNGKNAKNGKICKVCGKEGQTQFIKRHIESNHITGVSHPCDLCGKMSRSRAALVVHKSTQHRK